MMSNDESSTVMEEKGSNDDPKNPDFPKKTKTSYDVIIIELSLLDIMII